MSMISEQIHDIRMLYSWMQFHAQNRSSLMCNEHNMQIVKNAADTIEKLSAKLHTANMERSSRYYNGGWIPCEERAPRQSGKYWVTALSGRDLKTTVATYSPRYERFTPISTKAYSWKIIAWMPLPAPYRPKESEASND